MSEPIITALAPSNIALIKYMGKKDSKLNLPENPSLSLTLDGLCSIAEMTVSAASGSGELKWVSERPRMAQVKCVQVPDLEAQAVEKMVRHFARVKANLGQILGPVGLTIDETKAQSTNWDLRTANTFPASSGIASSASSFAAMTLVMAAALAKDIEAFEKAFSKEKGLRKALAGISRMGSGSSCRSFDGPWVYWENDQVECVDSAQMPAMAHFVILIETRPKKVSSSQAHSLVRKSPLWENRVERVLQKCAGTKAALRKGDLKELAHIVWAEAWEMHSLFHTCPEPFSYWAPGTVDALNWFGSMIHGNSLVNEVPPIVTLDAGPNVHVIVPESSREIWRNRLVERFQNASVLEDRQGSGAKILSHSI